MFQNKGVNNWKVHRPYTAETKSQGSKSLQSKKKKKKSDKLNTESFLFTKRVFVTFEKHKAYLYNMVNVQSIQPRS